MTEKYLLFSLDDEQAKKLGEVISNSTCKKIAGFLAEKEASESDIARELSLPLNTVEYNLKKLLGAGIIEKSKNFFWSSKGKKILTYKIANKLIVISPKKTSVYSKLKSVVPVVLISAIFTAFVAWYFRAREVIQENLPKAAETLAKAGVAEGAQTITETVSSNVWIWFAIGSLMAIIVFFAWNWKKL